MNFEAVSGQQLHQIIDKIETIEKEKNPAAISLGKLGGKARAKKLSKERRSEISRLAVQARWKKIKETQIEVFSLKIDK